MVQKKVSAFLFLLFLFMSFHVSNAFTEPDAASTEPAKAVTEPMATPSSSPDATGQTTPSEPAKAAAGSAAPPAEPAKANTEPITPSTEPVKAVAEPTVPPVEPAKASAAPEVPLKPAKATVEPNAALKQPTETLAKTDPAPQKPAQKATPSARGALTVEVDKSECKAQELLKITGRAPKGKPVFIEVASGKNVEVRRLDSKKDKVTGKVPWIFYTSDDVPAYYTMLIPATLKDKVETLKKQKDEWSFSGALKDLGINPLKLRPDEGTVERRKTSIIAVITGSRGKLMEPMDNEGDLKNMLPLYKNRFKSPGALLKPVVDRKPDGSFEASLKLPKGSADGAYTVTAFTDNKNKAITSFTVTLPPGTWYFERAGMAMNVLGPFFLALVVTMLGVLMGAGGGFILNPLLIMFYGLPHAVVSGTVLPTVLFSQMSGIYNYNKIKFINWKLGLVLGTCMLAGGFIGPVLTQLISLSQYKSWFGIVLFILAGLMLWQTLPSQVARNRHEQEILKQFKKKAEEAKRT